MNGASPPKHHQGTTADNQKNKNIYAKNALIPVSFWQKNDNNSFSLLWYNISLVLHTQIRVKYQPKKTNLLWLLVKS
jgi:hypothetical protein